MKNKTVQCILCKRYVSSIEEIGLVEPIPHDVYAAWLLQTRDGHLTFKPNVRMSIWLCEQCHCDIRQRTYIVPLHNIVMFSPRVEHD